MSQKCHTNEWRLLFAEMCEHMCSLPRPLIATPPTDLAQRMQLNSPRVGSCLNVQWFRFGLCFWPRFRCGYIVWGFGEASWGGEFL